MAGHAVLAVQTTVQVLGPTVVNDVWYVTIQTPTSGVIASRTIPAPSESGVVGAIEEALPLIEFSTAIEACMDHGHTIAGRGSQTIDASGLLADNVVFTVQYVPPGSTGTNITADVTIPNTVLLATTTGEILGAPVPIPDMTEAFALLDNAYQNLANLAGG